MTGLSAALGDPQMLAVLVVAVAALLSLIVLCSAHVAIAVAGMAARIYVGGDNPERLADAREEWSCYLLDVGPLERPAHAGSLAWAAVVAAERRRRAPADDLVLAPEPIEVIPQDLGWSPLRLEVPPHVLSQAKINLLKDVLAEFPGDSPVFIHVGDKVVRLPDAWSVEGGGRLVSELRGLLGAECILAARRPAPSPQGRDERHA